MNSRPLPADPTFLRALPDAARRAVLSRAARCDYRAGDMICAQGAPADAVYLIVRGTVHWFDACTFARVVLRAGDSFGERDALGGGNYSAYAFTVTDAQVMVLSKHDFDFPRAPARVFFPRLVRGVNLNLIAVALVVVLIGGLLTTGVLFLGAVSSNVQALEFRAPPTSVARSSSNANTQKIATLADSSDDNAKAPAIHSVAAGDTLSGIAQMHGATVTQLRTLNDLQNDVIRVGQRVTLPRDALMPQVIATRAPSVSALRPQPTSAPRVIAQPTPTPVPIAAPAAAPTPIPREWKMPAWTSVEDAPVAAGQKYYRLIKAIYFDEASAGGRVNILVGVLDENGKELADIPVRMEWGAGEYTTRQTEAKRDPFLIPYSLSVIAAHDMASGSSFSPERGESGGYKISVEGLPSDVVSGMGLPMRRHVAFLLVYQRTTK